MDGSLMSGTTTYFGITYPTSTDLVKDGASNMQTIATGFDSAVAIPTYNAQTGTTYTFVLLDAAKVVTASNASASTYTIPPQASVIWTTGATLRVTNLGAGVVTFAGGVGVTVTNTAQTLAQYQSANLVRTGSDAWTVLPESGGASGLTLVKTQVIGSAVSSVAVTGAFSATYDAYRVIVAGGVASSEQNIVISLTGSAASYYNAGIDVTYAGVSSIAANNNGANFQVAGRASTNYIQVDFDLIAPALAQYTRFSSRFISNLAAISQLGVHQVATAYTGFTITPNAGTLTGGTIRVYGYQNS